MENTPEAYRAFFPSLKGLYLHTHQKDIDLSAWPKNISELKISLPLQQDNGHHLLSELQSFTHLESLTIYGAHFQPLVRDFFQLPIPHLTFFNCHLNWPTVLPKHILSITTNIHSKESCIFPALKIQSATIEQDLWLISFPKEKKIAVIKLIRDSVKRGLKDAKERADNLPSRILSRTTQEQLQTLQQKFQLLGATTTISLLS